MSSFICHGVVLKRTVYQLLAQDRFEPKLLDPPSVAFYSKSSQWELVLSADSEVKSLFIVFLNQQGVL